MKTDSKNKERRKKLLTAVISVYKELLNVMETEQLEAADQLLLAFSAVNALGLSFQEQKRMALKSMTPEKKQLCEIGFDLGTFSILDAVYSSLVRITERDVSHLLQEKRRLLMYR